MHEFWSECKFPLVTLMYSRNKWEIQLGGPKRIGKASQAARRRVDTDATASKSMPNQGAGEVSQAMPLVVRLKLSMTGRTPWPSRVLWRAFKII